MTAKKKEPGLSSLRLEQQNELTGATARPKPALGGYSIVLCFSVLFEILGRIPDTLLLLAPDNITDFFSTTPLLTPYIELEAEFVFGLRPWSVSRVKYRPVQFDGYSVARNFHFCGDPFIPGPRGEKKGCHRVLLRIRV